MESFEIHITTLPENYNELKQYCDKTNIKYIKCLNSSGVHPIQCMTTYKFSNINSEYAITIALEKCEQLINNGFTVIRTKVEKLLSMNSKYALEKDQYFESHFKIYLCDENKKNSLMTLISSLEGIYNSTNSTKYCDESIYPREILLSIRKYEIDIDYFFKLIEDFKLKLIENNYQIISIQREASVYDDNIDLDNGW